MGKEVFESRGLQGKEEVVETVKAKAGELHDLIKGQFLVAGAPNTAEVNRMMALAVTNLEQCVMWFTKGVSRS